MTKPRVDVAIRMTVLGTVSRMNDSVIEFGNSVNEKMLDLFIQVELLERNYTFTTEKSKSFFISGVMKELRNDFPVLFDKFFKNVNDRIFI